MAVSISRHRFTAEAILQYRLEVGRRLEEPAYRDVAFSHRGDRIAPTAFPALIFDVAAILG
jgi:hypothetical protein